MKKLSKQEQIELAKKCLCTPERFIETINKSLQNVGDGLPGVSLSVGVAISTMGYNQILEEQADMALYHVKKGGRCNCSFYSVEQN